MTHKIVVTNPIHTEVRDRLAQIGEVVMNSSNTPWTHEELTSQLSDATAMMGFMTDCVNAETIADAPKLQVIAAALKGFDSYDVVACTSAGVWLTIVPDLLTEPTAELAIGLAIALGRHLRHGDAYVRSGKFDGWRSHYFGTGLRGSTIAIVGLGQVGRAIADQLGGFRCAHILGVDPHAQHANVTFCSLDEAMRRADFVFVAVPLTPDSRSLISAPQIAAARAGQLLINVGRGSVVDESAVLQALDGGQLGGYAADVFACEDWSLPDRPEKIDARLLLHPNTVFTPHLGSAVRNVRLAIEHRAADNIIAVLQGGAPMDAINHPKEPRDVREKSAISGMFERRMK
ncbi:MAG: hydroxyacid dehydrogenase [Rhodocyclaceae bacterium]|nr:hydroxyacid dehydrogenase [Rhodocyclaceae bacterium]